MVAVHNTSYLPVCVRARVFEYGKEEGEGKSISNLQGLRAGKASRLAYAPAPLFRRHIKHQRLPALLTRTAQRRLQPKVLGALDLRRIDGGRVPQVSLTSEKCASCAPCQEPARAPRGLLSTGASPPHTDDC